MPKHRSKRSSSRFAKSKSPHIHKETKTELALYEETGETSSSQRSVFGILHPLDRDPRTPLFLSSPPQEMLSSGDIVRFTYTPPPRSTRRMSHAHTRVLEKVGSAKEPYFFSRIAALKAQIPLNFPKSTLREATALSPPDMDGYEDLTHLPFVTIDGENARDFDDAVWATPDDRGENLGGFVLKVAVADVSFYVRPGTSLDTEAYLRGNSTYFSTHMLPMLPERLATDLCSLKPHVNRPTLVATLTITKRGELVAWHFTRSMIRSHGRLTYTALQSYYETYIVAPHSPRELPLKEDFSKEVRDLIPILYEAYHILRHQRKQRGTLDFELPDPQLTVDEANRHIEVNLTPVLESHQLIEEFMIAANRAAALTLEKASFDTLFRIHPEPSLEKQEELSALLETIGLEKMSWDKITPQIFSDILEKTKFLPKKEFIHTLLLRMQSQALYHPDNQGHFGLNLSHYTHFTSPIRRYADLLVHRNLITLLSLGPGGWQKLPSAEDFAAYGEHLSQTEKQSTQAERESFQRYVIATLENKKGSLLKGMINGVHKSGIFVTVQDLFAEGFLPFRFLPKDNYILNEETHTLQGRNHIFHLGDIIQVKVVEANPYTRSLIFSLDGGKNSQKKEFTRASHKKKIKPQEKKMNVGKE